MFRVGLDGLELIEIAPGLDLERDVIAHMGFRPAVSPELKTMDARIFDPAPMGLAARHPRQAAPISLGARRALACTAREGSAVSSIRIDGTTRLYAIVGDPIAQVRSPEVFTEGFAAAGINAVMLPVQVLPETFDTSVPGLMALGNLDGLLVTVPYKARMLEYATRAGRDRDDASAR